MYGKGNLHRHGSDRPGIPGNQEITGKKQIKGENITEIDRTFTKTELNLMLEKNQ